MSWSTAIGLIFAAIVINGAGLYWTSSALARALEPVERDDPEEVVEFALVEPDGGPFAPPQDSNDLRPEEPEQLADEDSTVEPETQTPSRPDPAPAQPAKRQREGGERGQEPVEQDEPPTGAGDDDTPTSGDGLGASRGAAVGVQRPKSIAGLGGSTSALNDTFGRPAPSDIAARDPDKGVSSILDNREHLFASFFNRNRDRVKEQWRPQKAHDAVDPKHTKYGESSRTTYLLVRLNTKGEVVKIVVAQSSGAPHLDEEAVRAMRAAAPFPNVPEGLADSNGYIDFPFGFILDFNGGSQIFRYSK